MGALDVPAVSIKAADVPTMELLGRELRLPFKVRAEIRAWVCVIIGQWKRPLVDRVDPDAKRTKLGVLTSETVTAVGTDGDTPPRDNLRQANQKHDDAKVPVHLWNDRARRDSHLKLSDQDLDCIRVCLLWYWKRLVATEFSRHCKRWHLASYEIGLDSVLTSICVVATALSFAAKMTWWDWPKAPRFVGDPPSYRQRQRPHKDPGVQAKERNKVRKVRRRSYIAPS
jgi:hypothetical protein